MFLKEESEAKISKKNAGKDATNTKTGSQGVVVDEYTDTSSGKKKVTVKLLNGKIAYWLASATKIEK